MLQQPVLGLEELDLGVLLGHALAADRERERRERLLGVARVPLARLVVHH